jgi:lipopolysaccharide biosynthesis protein
MEAIQKEGKPKTKFVIHGQKLAKVRDRKLINPVKLPKPKIENIIPLNLERNVGVLVHLYYEDTFESINKYLKNLKKPLNVKFYFNLVKKSSNTLSLKNKILKHYPDAVIISSSNIGKDIGGKLNLIKVWLDSKNSHEFLIFCHDKKSPHMKGDGGKKWRDQLLTGILNYQNIIKTIHSFDNLKNIGMTGSYKWLRSGSILKNMICGSTKNKKFISNYLNMCNFNKTKVSFIGGTMFWVKADLFRKFFTQYEPEIFLRDLEEGDVREPSRTHAFERIFGAIVINNNKIVKGI